VEGFGWTTFSATVWRQVSHSVDTTAGAVITVDITKIYLSRATPVLLLTVCSSLHCDLSLNVDTTENSLLV